MTARNALGRSEDESGRKIATMLYGEVRPYGHYGHFRFLKFGHPPPLVFSAEHRKFMDVDKSRTAQFRALACQFLKIIQTVLGTFRCNSDSGQAPLMSARSR